MSLLFSDANEDMTAQRDYVRRMTVRSEERAVLTGGSSSTQRFSLESSSFDIEILTAGKATISTVLFGGEVKCGIVSLVKTGMSTQLPQESLAEGLSEMMYDELKTLGESGTEDRSQHSAEAFSSKTWPSSP